MDFAVDLLSPSFTSLDLLTALFIASLILNLALAMFMVRSHRKAARLTAAQAEAEEERERAEKARAKESEAAEASLEVRLKQAEEAQVHRPAKGTPMYRAAEPSGMERAGPLLAQKPKYRRPPILPRDVVGESIEVEDEPGGGQDSALAITR